MRISVEKARKWLTVIWFVGAGILFAVIFFQTVFGYYGEKSKEAWSWLLPNVMPSLSLIIGILVANSLKNTPESETVDQFVFRLSSFLSVVYLIVVSLTIFLGPLSSTPPLELMRNSSLWLGPLQGLVSGSLGAFFVSKSKG